MKALVLSLLGVVLAAWPTPMPLPTLVPAPHFSTPSLPAPTIHPLATPHLPAPTVQFSTPNIPTPALNVTPAPTSQAVYTDSVEVFTQVISAANVAIDEFGTGIDDLATSVGVPDSGSGDWTPGFITTTTAYEMADTLASRMGASIAYLKAISTLGLSSGSLLGPTVIFLLTALGWIGFVLALGTLIKFVFWLIDFVGDIMNAIPFV